MRRYLALFVAFAVTMAIATVSLAQVKFKDVPDTHWAASSVYDLVKMGVTKGYPDGTFRGKKQITRYETAIFLAKLAKAIGSGGGVDVTSDIRALKKDIAALKMRKTPVGGGMPISGGYMASWKFGNLLAEAGGIRGAVADYRLKLSATQDVGEGANVVINLDTMDYGFMDSDPTTSTGGNLATELLDIESNLLLDLYALGLENPVALKLTYGPGAQQHADPTRVLPSEVGVTYIRPYTGVVASTSLWGMDVSGGYIAKKQSTAGRIQTSQITGTVGYAFEGVPMVDTLKLEASGDYISAGQFSSSSRDMRAKIAMAAPLAEKVSASGTFGYGGSGQKNWMVAGEVTLNDVWNTGTITNIRVSKIGSDYIADTFAAECFDLAGFDSFNRPLEEGTVNLGGEIVQKVSDDVKLIGKGDIRLAGDYQYEAPKGRLTAEGGISYAVAPNTSLDAMYRLHQDKLTGDTSDVVALGLMYNF